MYESEESDDSDTAERKRKASGDSSTISFLSETKIFVLDGTLLSISVRILIRKILETRLKFIIQIEFLKISSFFHGQTQLLLSKLVVILFKTLYHIVKIPHPPLEGAPHLFRCWPTRRLFLGI